MSDARHTPVLLRETLSALAPAVNEVYVDATFGAGGYTRAILDAAPCSVIAFDRDPNAIAAAAAWKSSYSDRLRHLERPFADMETALAAIGVHEIDGAVFDLGVSSMQLDDAHRGFSFRHDGPLSMRMDEGRPNAADVINAASEADLTAIFRAYGEEKRARQLAAIIVRERESAPIETTRALADLIEAHTPARMREKIHPATRIFQALRIFVNDELGQLARALKAAERLLKPAGRLVVVTFHSLEDRIVKRFFAERSGRAGGASRHAPAAPEATPSFRLIRSGSIAPNAEEVAANPRARSAKLRAGVRLEAPAWASDDFAFGGPDLPGLASFTAR